MSYFTSINIAPSLVAAALALDTVDACKNHKLTDEVVAPGERRKGLSLAGKHHKLALVMREATDRFLALASEQTILSPDEFFKQAWAGVQELKAERKAVATYRREKRDREQADTVAMQLANPLSA